MAQLRFEDIPERFAQGRQNALANQRGQQAIQAEAQQAPIRNQLNQLNLEQAQVGAQRGARDDAQSQAINRANIMSQTLTALKGIPEEQRGAAIRSLAPRLAPFDIDTSKIQQNMSDKQIDESLAGLQGLIRDPSKITAAQKEFATLTEGFSEKERGRARRVKAGLEPRAVGSAVQTISDTGKAVEIAKTEQIIAEGKEFGKLTGSSRSKAIDSGFSNIQGIDKNIRNIDRAIEAIDQGANTGAIESRFFPSIKAASVALDQIQSELALDVVGATTFGALSEGELALARDVALPTKLNEPELRVFLLDKKAAQEKLKAYFQEQINFLDDGGTVAGFLRSKERQAPAAQAAPAAQIPQQGGVTFLGFE